MSVGIGAGGADFSLGSNTQPTFSTASVNGVSVNQANTSVGTGAGGADFTLGPIPAAATPTSGTTVNGTPVEFLTPATTTAQQNLINPIETGYINTEDVNPSLATQQAEASLTALNSQTPVTQQPASVQSASNQAALGDATTAASQGVLNALNSILSGITTGTNATAAGSGGGVGSSDTSLPAPSTADVEALQPTAAPTSSSGPSIWIILGILALLGFAGWWYIKHHKKGNSE